MDTTTTVNNAFIYKNQNGSPLHLHLTQWISSSIVSVINANPGCGVEMGPFLQEPATSADAQLTSLPRRYINNINDSIQLQLHWQTVLRPGVEAWMSRNTNHMLLMSIFKKCLSMWQKGGSHNGYIRTTKCFIFQGQWFFVINRRLWSMTYVHSGH